jgi:chemotaxis protein methyltransferase CheR
MKIAERLVTPADEELLARRIEEEMGLAFPAGKRRGLQRALRRMAESGGFDDAGSCVEWLLAGSWDEQKADLCAHHLTIGETYFFREPRAFELLSDYARKKIAAGNGQRLRIWSAGCCTGEEPYSIAIALQQVLSEADWRNTDVLATDINNRFLLTARAGVYRQWSFRNTGDAFRSRYFQLHGEGGFLINDDIRNKVDFAHLNLASAEYPSVANGTHGMDIIFCRNVLMYFSRERMKKIVQRFRQCLVEGGWLIVNPSEASSELFAGFTAHCYPDAIYYQKQADAPALPRYPIPPVSPLTRDSRPFSPGRAHARRAMKAAAPAAATPRPGPGSRPGRVARHLDTDQAAGRGNALPDSTATARALADGGRVDEAMRFLDQALGAAPSAAGLYYVKAQIAMEAGDRRAAVQSLKRVIYLEPDFILAHYLLGIIHSAEARHDEARRQFETTIGLLGALADDDPVPGSEGLHAAYLREAVAFRLREDGR